MQEPPGRPGASSQERKADDDKDKAVETPAVHTVPSHKKHTSSPKTSALTSYTDSARRSSFIQYKDSVPEIDVDFGEIFRTAQEAIHAGLHPDLVTAGSSGSYFVKDMTGKFIGIFKPKDEEPFAPLNPKWPKFFQRIMCFCCFGRACLIPNSGYLSETGASVIDQRLGLNIVPKTRVVKLASPSFYYERTFCGCWSRPVDPTKLRPKEGSFQLFVHGYEAADRVMARWDYDPSLLSPEERARFLLLFQKMIVLDYIIRNTDRHYDNWLIRHVPGKELELAVIDNGLAFPVKHPEVISRLRQYPFKWQKIKFAEEPWNEELRLSLLEKLTPSFVHEITKEIKTLFRHDLAVNRPLVFNQLRVLRGQLRNLRIALESRITPAEMARMEPILVKKRYKRGRAPSTDAAPSDWSPYFKAKSAFTEAASCCCCSCCGRSGGSPPLPSTTNACSSTPSPVINEQPLPSDSKREEATQ